MLLSDAVGKDYVSLGTLCVFMRINQISHMATIVRVKFTLVDGVELNRGLMELTHSIRPKQPSELNILYGLQLRNASLFLAS